MLAPSSQPRPLVLLQGRDNRSRDLDQIRKSHLRPISPSTRKGHEEPRVGSSLPISASRGDGELLSKSDLLSRTAASTSASGLASGNDCRTLLRRLNVRAWACLSSRSYVIGRMTAFVGSPILRSPTPSGASLLPSTKASKRVVACTWLPDLSSAM